MHEPIKQKNNMQISGIALLILGTGLLVWLGFIGIDTGIGFRMTNIAGLVLGLAAFISGAVLIGAGAVVQMINQQSHDLKVMIGVPERAMPSVTEKKIQMSTTVGGHSVVKGVKPAWEFRGKTYKLEADARKAESDYREMYGRSTRNT